MNVNKRENTLSISTALTSPNISALTCETESNGDIIIVNGCFFRVLLEILMGRCYFLFSMLTRLVLLWINVLV